MNVNEVCDGARVYLGDLGKSNYEDSDLRRALSAVVFGTVGNDIGVNFSFDAGVQDFTPVPGQVEGAILSIALALAMIFGDRSGAIRDGVGISFKSGLSSISLAGQERVFKETVQDLMGQYKNHVDKYLVGKLDGSVIDLYNTTGTDTLTVN